MEADASALAGNGGRAGRGGRRRGRAGPCRRAARPRRPEPPGRSARRGPPLRTRARPRRGRSACWKAAPREANAASAGVRRPRRKLGTNGGSPGGVPRMAEILRPHRGRRVRLRHAPPAARLASRRRVSPVEREREPELEPHERAARDSARRACGSLRGRVPAGQACQRLADVARRIAGGAVGSASERRRLGRLLLDVATAVAQRHADGRSPAAATAATATTIARLAPRARIPRDASGAAQRYISESDGDVPRAPAAGRGRDLRGRRRATRAS